MYRFKLELDNTYGTHQPKNNIFLSSDGAFNKINDLLHQ